MLVRRQQSFDPSSSFFASRVELLYWLYIVVLRTDVSSPDYTRGTRRNRTAQLSWSFSLTEQTHGHVTWLSGSVRSAVLSTLSTLITVPTVRISLVYRNSRCLRISSVQLIVHSDCLVSTIPNYCFYASYLSVLSTEYQPGSLVT